MTDGGREWLAGQALPATAREQITVAIAMIDGSRPSSRRSTSSCAVMPAASAAAAR